MNNIWFENHMMFDGSGNYSPSDNYEDSIETTYVQCQSCRHYVHPSRGIVDERINEFFCNECDKEYQQNNKND